MERENNRRKKYIIVGIFILACLIVGGIFLWKKYPRNKKNVNNGVKYSDNLFYKSVDSDKVARIPNQSLEYVVDEIIIDVAPDIIYEEVEKLVQKHDADIIGYIKLTNTYQIETRDNLKYEDLLDLRDKLEHEESITGAYLNKIYTIDNLEGYYPNDSEWKNEWSSTVGGKNWALEFMETPEAWYYMRNIALHTPERVRIGVFEVEGIDYKHEDLKDNFIEPPLCNREDQNHGTAVSGIIGAGFDNGIGYAGVVPDVKLQAVSYNGISDPNKESSMVMRTGLAYLLSMNNDNQKTTIINVSYGFEIYAFAASRGNAEAIEILTDLNKELEVFLGSILDNGYDFLICKGAGNNNAILKGDKTYYYVRADTDDDNAICGYISASDEASQKYKKLKDYQSRLSYGNVDAQYDIFSGITKSEIRDRIIVVGSIGITEDNLFYASDYSCSGSRVDILAPGENIYVLEPENKYSTKPGWGTSYSAPYVSGVAGLILSVNPNLSGKELKALLIQSATGNYVGLLNGQKYEYRAVNASRAVRYADAHESVYTWGTEPTLEADNIYYLNSNDAWKNPINMLNKQLDTDYGYAVIKKDETYGLIDLEGNLLDGMNFQTVGTHVSRYHVTYTEPHYDSMTGTETTEFDLTDNGLSFPFGHGDSTFLYGGCYFWDNGLKQYYFANEMSDPDIPIPVQKNSEELSGSSFKVKNDLAERCKNLSEKYAVYADGNLITDFIYDECGSYSEGLMAVCRDGKWGYINKNGEIIVPLEYDASWKEYIPYENQKSLETKDFCYAASDGYVVLCKGDNWELKDIQGDEVIQQGIFEEIRPVKNGKCWVKKNGKWGIIQIKKDTESILKDFFYTWLDQWKFEGREIMVDSWRNNKVDFSKCLAFIDPYSELSFTFKEDSDFGGRLANSVALNIQELDIKSLGNNKYVVTVSAYLTQNTVDQKMYEQMVKNGYKTFEYELTVNEDGLISELSKLN